MYNEQGLFIRLLVFLVLVPVLSADGRSEQLSHSLWDPDEASSEVKFVIFTCFVCNCCDEFDRFLYPSAESILYNCTASLTSRGERDLDLQFAGEPSCRLICDIMHTMIWSIELLGHQRHLTSSAEPEVMQSHWPRFQ